MKKLLLTLTVLFSFSSFGLDEDPAALVAAAVHTDSGTWHCSVKDQILEKFGNAGHVTADLVAQFENRCNSLGSTDATLHNCGDSIYGGAGNNVVLGNQEDQNGDDTNK